MFSRAKILKKGVGGLKRSTLTQWQAKSIRLSAIFLKYYRKTNADVYKFLQTIVNRSFMIMPMIIIINIILILIINSSTASIFRQRDLSAEEIDNFLHDNLVVVATRSFSIVMSVHSLMLSGQILRWWSSAFINALHDGLAYAVIQSDLTKSWHIPTHNISSRDSCWPTRLFTLIRKQSVSLCPQEKMLSQAFVFERLDYFPGSTKSVQVSEKKR